MGTGYRKINDDVLVNLYEKYGSVWKVAEMVGMCGQSVHERLSNIGKIHKMNHFTDQDVKTLETEYSKYKNKGKLNDLADSMGRTKQFICRKAKELGLTDRKSLKPYAEKKGSNPYSKFHARIRSLRGCPHKCEICGEDNKRKWYDWANLTGKYDDPDDYKRMCRKCHRKYDKNRYNDHI